jgi:hypothetical protein
MNNAVTCFSFSDRVDLGPADEVFLDGEDFEVPGPTCCDACDSPVELVVDDVPLCAACLARSEGGV